MGLIDIVKPLSAVLGSPVDKSQLHQEKNSWECRELNPGCWERSNNSTSVLRSRGSVPLTFAVLFLGQRSKVLRQEEERGLEGVEDRRVSFRGHQVG